MRTLNLKDESGQAMILTLLSMTILLGFVGFATDVGVMFHVRRNMQIAADGAAVAAAAELNYGDSAAAGQAAAAQNGVVNGVNGDTVAINIGPLSGPFAGNPNYVEAVVTQTQPTIFIALFNQLSMNVSARAVATLGPADGCIYTLAAAGSGLVFNGMTASVPTCAIVDNSVTDPTGLTAAGGATVNAAFIGVVGGYSNTGGAVTPNPITGIVPVNDPLAYLTPPAFDPASCVTGTNITADATLPQGCYQGLTISGAGTVTLTGGTYIINGTLTITGTPTIIGTGVTFYFPNITASMNDTGTPTLQISAPTSGTYDGMLFYQDPTDLNPLAINAVNTSDLQGIVYAPNANVSLTSDASTTFDTSVVASTLTLNGTGAFQDYAQTNPGSVLTAARLVE
jgi:Flp pilus assembly protein TadG